MSRDKRLGPERVNPADLRGSWTSSRLAVNDGWLLIFVWRREVLGRWSHGCGEDGYDDEEEADAG